MKQHDDNGKAWSWSKPQMVRRSNNHGEGVRHHNDAPAPDMKKRGVRIVAHFGCAESGRNLRQKVRYSREEIREHNEVQNKAAAFKRRNVIVKGIAKVVERIGKVLKPVFRLMKEVEKVLEWEGIDWLRNYVVFLATKPRPLRAGSGGKKD